MLTGTPICNKEDDLLSLCYIIGIPSYMVVNNEDELKTDKLMYRTKQDVGIVMPQLVSKDVSIVWDTTTDEYKVSQLFHSQVTEPEKWVSNLAQEDSDHFNENPLKKRGLWIRARQACIHPSLLRSYFNTSHKVSLIGDIEDKNIFTDYSHKYLSQKMKAILSTLYNQHSLYPENNRIIFCNYIDEMNILKDNITQFYTNKGIDVPSIELINSRISKKKQATILENKETPTNILILQLSMCAEGLNLQNYNEVYFVSPTYNPSIEQQAIARCYRRGQQKDVYVFKFNMKSLVDYNANGAVNALSSKLPDEMISRIWDYIKPTRKGLSYNMSSVDEHITSLSQSKQDIIDKYILPSASP
jgi:superfamily II DNA or RNA helicase